MSWLDDYTKFAVFGLGASGVAAANLLARHGKTVIASDTRSHEELETRLDALDERVFVRTGGNEVVDSEIVVVSPGLRPSAESLAAIELPIVSEIELAWAYSAAPILAITGTDGKTTTTALTAHILAESGIHSVAAGNIGTPLSEVVPDYGADDWIVAEVSAFQLWSTHEFNARAAAITNIAADHLDYFATFDEYIEAKRTIFARATPEDTGVFNIDDPTVRTWLEDYPGRMVTYGTDRFEAAAESLWTDGVSLQSTEGGVFFEIANAPLRGRHNEFNMLAASALARAAGVAWLDISAALATFRPLPHRVEPCGEVDGVAYYDDSKATNAHAAIAGIQSLEGPLVVIAGGVDKGLDLEEFGRVLGQRCRAVVLIGEIRERLRQAIPEGTLILDAESMEGAVETASDKAKPGDSILLSPACSSFDMFDSYAHRGEVFQECVAVLRQASSTTKST